MQSTDQQLSHNETQQLGVKFPITVLVHNFQVPMNVGSLFRLADALGVEKLILSGDTPTPPNNKINKTARATVKAVTYEVAENVIETVSRLKKLGYKIVSLEITKLSIDLREFQVQTDDKICLIIGAESKGVNKELLNLSDEVIHIPMLGQNSSMNVATASAIALYEIAKSYMK